MHIFEVLGYVCLILSTSIYICFAKRNSYKKGFSDGVKHYSDMVEEVLHQTNQLNEKAKEDGKDLTVYVESIRPLNKAESEEMNENIRRYFQ